MGFIYSIIIGGLAGFLASKIMNSSNGLVMDIVLGILGGVLAGWLSGMLGFGNASSLISHLLFSVVGAVILIFIGRKLF